MIPSETGATLQVGLAYLVGNAFGPQQGVPPNLQILRPELALAGIMLAVPVVVFFFFIQRWLMRGLLAGYGVG
jgi:ABC-type glycerol-3-phosphate transport system permease component